MMLLNTPPDAGSDALADYYRRCADEGVVFRGTMNHQYFGVADAFDPAWSVAAVCWCAGGVEEYAFAGRGRIRLKAGAVLAIGERERYAFTAEGTRPFLSSMIVFPSAMTRSLRDTAALDSCGNDGDAPVIETRLFRPGTALMARMEAVAAACARGATISAWYEEQAALVAADLIAAQHGDRRHSDRIDAVKRSTRAELVRRLRRAVGLIHDGYDDPRLDLASLAREACIARYHFVRVFSAVYGVTPLRYLGGVRMEAAARLLESIDAPVAEVARSVGLKNRCAFQRSFRRHFGSTPADWRRRARSGEFRA